MEYIGIGMSWFVYHQDDDCEMGGVDIEGFSTKKEALEFINKRIQHTKSDDPNRDYVLIEGKRVMLEVVKRIVQVDVKGDR